MLICNTSNNAVFSVLLQTDSPVQQAANRRSGDAPLATQPIVRQRTAPVFVPGSLPDSGHLQDSSILVQPTSRIHTTNPRYVPLVVHPCRILKAAAGSSAQTKQLWHLVNVFTSLYCLHLKLLINTVLAHQYDIELSLITCLHTSCMGTRCHNFSFSVCTAPRAIDAYVCCTWNSQSLKQSSK